MTATDTFERDYLAATAGCGLLDRSERGKLALSGAGAKEFLNGQVSNEIVALQADHGLYAALLTPKGKMLGDLRVLDAGQELLLDTERPALQELFNTIRRFSIGYDVQLHKRTLESGLLSLIGPHSQAIAAAVTGGRLPGENEHDHLSVQIENLAARLIRTNTGIDVLFASESLTEIRTALITAGASEISEGAAECVRIESGRPRYGVDLDDSVIPQEAGLNERAVSFTKGCYVGQETVARLFYRGKPNRHLQGLRGSEPLTPGSELIYEDRVVATVTSAALSPRFGAIGLALVRREAPVGATVLTPDGDRVTVVALPFA